MNLRISKHNTVYNRINTEDGIARELQDIFTFKASNYQFHPLYKARKWDGNIRLFSTRNRLLYAGLTPYVKKFCQERGYEYIIEDDLDTLDEFSLHEAEEFITSLKIPAKFTSRDYQIQSFVHCVRHRTSLFISPTASGKSLIIYWLIRYYLAYLEKKALIIVDSINLLNQMASDFAEYGFDSGSQVHLISAGSDKTSKKPIYITTWQSAAKQPKEWFDQFNIVIGDEAHRYKANSLKKIMESLTKCKYRFGFTGSLDGSQCNQMTLEGLFGPIKQIVTTKELIDKGFLSNIDIKAILLKYPDEVKKAQSKNNYESEISFLNAHEKRNRFIENLALSLKGNTILLYQRVDSHGKPLYDNLSKRAIDTPVYYVSGQIGGTEREEIRKIVNTHKNSITVASVGTFSIGVNIPNLNNIIIASPTKSVIRVLQTVGRGLRKTDIKTHVTVFDIADNLQWKTRQNYTLKHFADRMKIYIKEEFPYKLYPVEFK